MAADDVRSLRHPVTAPPDLLHLSEWLSVSGDTRPQLAQPLPFPTYLYLSPILRAARRTAERLCTRLRPLAGPPSFAF